MPQTLLLAVLYIALSRNSLFRAKFKAKPLKESVDLLAIIYQNDPSKLFQNVSHTVSEYAQRYKRTRYKALCYAGGPRGPLRLLRKEKQCEADKERFIVSANWRLENAKNPAAMLQKTIHRRHTREHNSYVPGILYLRDYIYIHIYACLEACDYAELLSLRMTNRHGHYLGVLDQCLLDVDGWRKQSNYLFLERGTCD